MPSSNFAPGFRLSIFDIFVLILGAVVSASLWMMTWWWGFVVAFVLVHFFLFCNLVRASRPLALTWAGVFLVLATGTITMEIPGWIGTLSASIITTAFVVYVEMRKPSYHGIFWHKINPDLPAWWDQHIVGRREVSQDMNGSGKG